MKAKILSFKEGLKTYEDVDMVRVVSEDYNLLIMKDYMPVLGEIRGRVDVISGERCDSFEDVEGFFIHSANEFELLITEDEYVG